MDSPRFDLVLWGATGFTGRLTARYLARQVAAGKASPRWALAGRDRARLEAVRADLATLDPAAAALPLLLGDSHDADSLAAIVAQTAVVCTTVGPYAFYGTPLVATCARLGRDYCDINGEVVWMAEMIERYQAEAEQTGARIVFNCGYDSIPSDLGVLLLQDEAEARLGRPCDEVWLLVDGMRGGPSGGTMATALHQAELMSDPATRRRLADPYLLVPADRRPSVRQPNLAPARWDEAANSWLGPSLMAGINTRVVHRTNGLLAGHYGEAFRYGEASRLGRDWRGRLRAHGMRAGMGLFYRLAAAPAARAALERWVLPAPGEGPSRQTRENGYFRLTLLGLVDGAVRVKGRVVGQQDPGYGETSKMLGESALCLALDGERLPDRAGVLTPATAMGHVLTDRLRAAGMTFSAGPVER